MKRKKWLIISGILILATIIDLFVPDPLPIVDEFLLIFFSLFSFYKTVTH